MDLTPVTPTESMNPALLLLSLPNELLLLVADNLDRSRDLYSLFLVNHHLASLLTPHLHGFAVENREGMSALQWAAYKGHLGLAKLLVDKGFDVNYCPPGGWRARWPPIFYAIRSCKFALVQLLLDNGADIDTRVFANSTLLHMTVYTMTNALELNFDSDETSEMAEFRLQAVEMPAVLQVLLGRQPAHWPINDYGYTALHEAARRCKNGKMASLELLLEHGVDVNHANIDGMTALHNAALRGRLEAAKFLVQQGAFVLAKNKEGYTPLQLAMRRGHATVIELLMEYEPVEDESEL
ncbi:hypothetical protein Q9L58_006856 [Maublancomyces gigas]|uniref:Uncharacterized protein n=1 Tax=Discina gigas TaxID=1032678 RepID=A0ABR3GEL1_9PEZI